MEEKMLGKITEATFGLGGYQDCSLGLHLTFESIKDKWGAAYTQSFWDFNTIKYNENCKWDEDDRRDAYINIMIYLSNILKDANVKTVDQLKNIPVEVVFNDNKLKEWRILTEVL